MRMIAMHTSSTSASGSLVEAYHDPAHCLHPVQPKSWQACNVFPHVYSKNLKSEIFSDGYAPSEIYSLWNIFCSKIKWKKRANYSMHYVERGKLLKKLLKICFLISYNNIDNEKMQIRLNG